MAVNLKLKKKCHIVSPDWLNVGMFVIITILFFLALPIDFYVCNRLPAGSFDSGNITACIQ
jgi:hypothetical protein